MKIRKNVLVSTIFVLIGVHLSLCRTNKCLKKQIDRCRKAFYSAEIYCSAAKKCIDYKNGKPAILQFEKLVHNTHPGLFTTVQDTDIALRQMYDHVGRVVPYPSEEFPEPPDRRPGQTVKGVPSLKVYKPVGSTWHPYPRKDYTCKVLHPLDPDSESTRGKSETDDSECLPCHAKAVSFFTKIEEVYDFDGEQWTPVHLDSLELYQMVHVCLCSDDKGCPNDDEGACGESYRYVYMYMRRTDYSKVGFKRVQFPSCCECHNVGEDS
ncbi:unnamed protein product [Owenia fusiformis]|uniref:Uncharacterized protein n=1 Tax=Owenia fusiformis TaxID=6347 RepID=A0A8J1UTR8_OWEFU|nr:unnamed protein product [Owenia fusiformis]